MRAAIISFTGRGAGTSLKIKKALQDRGYMTDCYTTGDFPAKGGEFSCLQADLRTVVGNAFCACSLLVFIGACGIAVRAIAPFLRDKAVDPAVICLDEHGKYVIPLLSGHIGGANRMARIIAADIGARPVITTATDINGIVAIDQWAVENNMHICDMRAAKKISALLLDGKAVGLYSDFKITGDMPGYFIINSDCQAGVCITMDESRRPFGTTLVLIPKIAWLGLGCKSGVSPEAVEGLVLDVLAKSKISVKALAGIATIDLKKQEEGLLRFAARYSLPLTFFTAGDLNSVSGEFSRSDFVSRIAGTDNVCERAAVLASQNGRLVTGKTVKNGVAAALAVQEREFDFSDYTGAALGVE